MLTFPHRPIKSFDGDLTSKDGRKSGRVLQVHHLYGYLAKKRTPLNSTAFIRWTLEHSGAFSPSLLVAIGRHAQLQRILQEIEQCTLRSSSAARRHFIQNLKSACFSQSAQNLIVAPSALQSLWRTAHAEIVSPWNSTPATLKQAPMSKAWHKVAKR